MRISSFIVSLVVTSSVTSAFISKRSHGFQPRSAVSSATSISMSAALIVQNKGGGHGELGYQLAKVLQDHPKITSVTILQDEACKDSAEPFCLYATDLPDVRVVKAPLADESLSQDAVQSLLGDGEKYDYVWDNASKSDVGAGKALCDCALAWGVKLYCYVSSAGMYQPAEGVPMPMPETTPIKESAGQNKLDQYAIALGLPLVSFRPQYIYGPKSNKYDYIDWYFDRLVRKLPLPIPGDGTQKVSLTNSQDVASLLSAPLNNEASAVEQRFFNCGTDKLYSYDEVAQLCAEAAGIPADAVQIEHYDANLFGKAQFPFRLNDFYVAPDMAKAKLGWEGPQHDLRQDLDWYYQSYQARGGATKQISWVKDWEIIVGSKTPQPGVMGSVYDQYDPIVIQTS